MIHPIIDEFSDLGSPSYSRSSQFAQDKGLVSSAPAGTKAQGSTAVEESQLADIEAVRKKLEVQMRKSAS